MAISYAVFLTVAAIMLFPRGGRLPRWMWRRLAWICARSVAALTLVFVVTFLLYAAPWIGGHVGPARVHDEISYLLAADTFRHGRLTNPSPPFWQSFEALHEIVTPTYASKFPPGQGLILALGWAIGSPRIGAILAGAIAAAATAWMARARSSGRIAVVAALIVALAPMVFAWTQGFWGGNLAMAGGALWLGAALRFRSKLSVPRTWAYGAIAGVGLAILANTRPFEGLLLAILAFAALLVRPMLRERTKCLRFTGGAMLILAPVIVWMAYYNHRVTGNAWQMPYALHARQYMVAPIFWWEGPRQPLRAENNYITAFHAQTEFREYDAQRSVKGFMRLAIQRIGLVLKECTYPLIGIIVLTGGLLAIRHSPTARMAVWLPAVFIVLHLATTPWLRAHYLAPVVPFWGLFIARAVHDLRRLPLARHRAATLVPAVSLALVVASAMYALSVTVRETTTASAKPDYRRDSINAIERMPGKHLVFVAHLPGPQSETQWVHNPADLDSAPVLFVHARDPATNTNLANHFADRSIWMMTVSADGANLQLAGARTATSK